MSATLEPRPAVSRALPALVLIFLVSAAASQSLTRFSRSEGVDLYQFWGVSTVVRLLGTEAGPPYGAGARYHEALQALSARAGDEKLAAASRFWKGPDFAGSPLLYTAFSLAPADYTVALGTIHALQVVLFLGAFLLSIRLHRLQPLFALCLAFLCVLFFNPLLSDIHVANLGSFQLAYLVGLVFLDRAVARARTFLPRAALAASFLAALAALTLSKPNVALITALLAASLGVRHGLRLFVAAAVPAAVVAAVLGVLPCLYFDSWDVWRQWYDFVYGADRYMLVRTVADGNYATPVILAGWLGLDVYAVATALLGLLGVVLLLVVVAARPAPLAAVRRFFGDPHAVLATGIVLTTAASPLYWLHYHVLAVIPIAWLLRPTDGSRVVKSLGAAALVMSSGILVFAIRLIGLPDAAPASIAFCWLPIWAGIVFRQVADRRAVSEPWT